MVSIGFKHCVITINREKSLALGERGLEGFDRVKCPSANFNDHVLTPVAASLRAKCQEGIL